MVEFEPLVSIIIPVYNGAEYIREAINSALAQTYKNIEIIVVNDGSTDNTEEIALSYGEKIRYIKKENGGVATALNTGIDNMKGDYFSWLSHDDLYVSNKIKKQIEALEKSEDKKMLVTCPTIIIDEHGNEIYRTVPFSMYTKEELSRPLFALLRGQIGGCCLLIHRSFFDIYGRFDPMRPTTQDFALWFAMMRKNRLVFIREALVKTRCHPKQDSKARLSEHIAECNDLWIGFLRTLSTQEMCDIDGSPYNFYYRTHKFLSENSGYASAISYAERCMIEALGNECLAEVDSRKESILLRAVSIIGLDNLDNPEVFFNSCQELLSHIKRKPRVAFYIGDRNDRKALAWVVYTVASYLCEVFEVIILVCNEKNEKALEIDERIMVIRLPETNDYSFKLAKVCCLLSIDVYVNSHNCWLDRISIIDYLEAYQIKTIAWNHEAYFLPYWNHDFHETLHNRNALFIKADVCAWLTSLHACIYSTFGRNAAVMPNPIKFADVYYENKINNDIIAVGRFDDPGKGLGRLLEVFSYVCKSVNNARLIVLGSYDLSLNIPDFQDKTYGQLIADLGIQEERIVFVGWTETPEDFYKKAKIHILTSFHEGFGLVITEAAAYGLPSLVFDETGFDDIIDDGVNGYIIPKGDTRLMGAKAIELLINDALYQKMVSSLPKMLEKYQPEIIKERWVKLIDTVLNYKDEELHNELKTHFMSVYDTEKVLSVIAKEYEDTVQRLLFKKKSYECNVNYENIEIRDLIEETNNLVSNICTIYNRLLSQTTAIPKQSAKQRIKVCCIRVIKAVLRPIKQVVVFLRLKPYVIESSIYVYLRKRGIF